MKPEIISPLHRARSLSIRAPRTLVFLLIASLLATMIGVVSADRATAATAKTVTLSASETGTVSSRKPTTVLKTQLSATFGQDRSYLRYSLPADFSASGTVRATLSLKVNYSTVTKAGVQVFPEKGAWKSTTLTYANRPAEAGKRLNATAPIAKKGARLTIALGDVSSAINKGAISLRLSYLQKYISSSYLRTGPDAPKLTLTYVPKAAATTTPTTKPTTPAAPAPSTSAKKIFAHYFPPYPISLDNAPAAGDYYARNYLTVGGENGKHAAYGGLLRDRPVGVAPSSSSSWKVDNLRREIRQAKSAGIDGFTVDIMSLSGLNWEATVNLMKAAELEGGFSVVPMVDVTASAGKATSSAVADKLAELYDSSAAFRTKSQYLLSSFRAEGQSVSWWKQIIDRLEKTHGVPITFQAVFLAANDANMQAFSGIADGYGNWGVRTEWHNENSPDYAAQAEKYGKTWMAPVSVQDYRPSAGLYAEASNTGNLRASWAGAIETNADFVQLVTWNDYSESTQFAPSVGHGDTFLDINSYYAKWFHDGRQPAIASDEVFLTHRTQFASVAPAVSQLIAKPTLGGLNIAPVDRVEALVFLTSPATVAITVGSTTSRFEVKAGVSAVSVPLKVGAASVTVTRSGTTVDQLTSPYRIVQNPTVQDLAYHGVSSVK